MGKVMIINEFSGGEKFVTHTAGTPSKVLAFASGVMDSKVSVFSQKSKTGSDSPTDSKIAVLHLRQMDGTDCVAAEYLRLLVKATTKEETLQAALAGKTIKGVRADKVGVSFRKVDF